MHTATENTTRVEPVGVPALIAVHGYNPLPRRTNCPLFTWFHNPAQHAGVITGPLFYIHESTPEEATPSSAGGPDGQPLFPLDQRKNGLSLFARILAGIKRQSSQPIAADVHPRLHKLICPVTGSLL